MFVFEDFELYFKFNAYSIQLLRIDQILRSKFYVILFSVCYDNLLEYHILNHNKHIQN